MYLGGALISSETHALVGFLLVVIAYIRKVRLEEEKLLEAFGRSYADYQQKTWGLIPGVR